MRLMIALLPLVSLLQGCLSCTEAGCAPNLRIYLDGPLSEGEHSLVIATGHDLLQCTFVWPSLDIVDGDCTDSFEEDALDFFRLPSRQAAVVAWTLDEDAGAVVSGVSALDWYRFYPNGEQCGGPCDSAGFVASW